MLNAYQPEFKSEPSKFNQLISGIFLIIFLLLIAGCYANNHTPDTRPEPEAYQMSEHPEYELPVQY